MMLSDVRDYIASLGIAEVVYMGKMDSKPEKQSGFTTASTGAYIKRQ